MHLLPPPRKDISFWLTFLKQALLFGRGKLKQKLKEILSKRALVPQRNQYLATALLDLLLIFSIMVHGVEPAQNIIGPLVSPMMQLKPLEETKPGHEVFGFAPFWTFDKLDNVDFNVLTTFAYFGIDVDGNGNLDKSGPGYETFKSRKATEIFKKAHANGTRVVLTVTQMKNDPILALMDNTDAQTNAINQIIDLVKKRGIDGVNVDLEYTGDPGYEYRQKFTKFVADLTERMHKEIPQSQVSVSVYASAIKEPKIYDIKGLGEQDIKIFMMAYDFAVAGSDNAIPTAPLYGHKSGKYWYDISTAVDDFLTSMPAEKLILGVPYYGYNYLVYEPSVKAQTRPYYSWRGTPAAQTYTIAKDNLRPDRNDIAYFHEGWDGEGQVGYIAYHVPASDTWRMIFLEDQRSLGIKYDFAKEKHLAGVGMWALGFDSGKQELWKLLADKFGSKSVADRKVSIKEYDE